jgi:hypothetical protein
LFLAKKEAFMSQLAKKKRIPRKGDGTALKAHESQGKAMNEKRLESEAIERAVYDGMQDLRVKRSR